MIDTVFQQRAQRELHGLDGVNKDQARTWPKLLSFRETNANLFPMYLLCLCFPSQPINAIIMVLMQTEMPGKYIAPAKEQVRMLLFFTQRAIQYYKEHIHKLRAKQLFQPISGNLYAFCHLLTQKTCTPMKLYMIKINGKGSQLVPQRLVRSGLLIACLQAIGINMIFAPCDRNIKLSRLIWQSWGPASQVGLRSWLYVVSQAFKDQ